MNSDENNAHTMGGNEKPGDGGMSPSGDGQKIQPEISSDDLGYLQEQNAALSAMAAEYLESLQRERASFANYKRRVEQDAMLERERALGNAVKPFLLVVDDLMRALAHCPTDPDCENWIAGIELILQKLNSQLQAKGVEALDLKAGDFFDPNNQEAISHEDSDDFSDGQIIEVVQTGYKIKDTIIRPALVRVAK